MRHNEKTNRLKLFDMKKILFLFLLIPQLLNAQSRIVTYEILYEELKNASSSVLIDFYLPENKEKKKLYNVGLITKNLITEPVEYETYNEKLLQNDIVIDSSTIRKIIEIFDERGLLKKLYIKQDSIYNNIGITERIRENDFKLAVSLFYPSKKDYLQVYILMKEKDNVVELLEIVSKLLNENEQKIFKEMIDPLK